MNSALNSMGEYRAAPAQQVAAADVAIEAPLVACFRLLSFR